MRGIGANFLVFVFVAVRQKPLKSERVNFGLEPQRDTVNDKQRVHGRALGEQVTLLVVRRKSRK